MARHEIESEVTGIVYTVEISVGDTVDEGDALLFLESMKMQIPVEAPRSGTVVEILVQRQDTVQEGQRVAVIES